MTRSTVQHALRGSTFSSGARYPRVGVIQTLYEWQERARSRAALRNLDERMLKDLGLTSYDVEREASKPFWRA